MRRIAVLVGVAGGAVGPVAEASSFGFGDPADWIPDLVTGWTLIGAGLVAWQRRPESRVGLLLMATGFTWFLANLSGVDVAWLAWIATHGVYVHRGPLVNALVTFPTGRATSRPERVAVVGGYVAAFVNPVWANEWVTIGLAVALVVFTIWRYTTAVARERRARRTAMLLAAAIGAVVAVGAAARLAFPGDIADDAALLAYQSVLCVTAIGLTYALVIRPWDLGVTDLVVELGGARSDGLRDSLSRALGDTTLQVGYWSPETAEFVDAAGTHLALPSDGDQRAATVVEVDGGPVAVIVHHPSLLDDPALVASVGAATRLAASNTRLQAEVQAQIAELDASRRRLVTAGDEEQRRLEARLRSGAEQRLASLSTRIQQAHESRGDGSVRELLAEIDEQLTLTVEELRSLAAGLHPRLLTDCGLAGALEALAVRCPTQVQVKVSPDVGRLPDTIEVAIYFACSEALTNVIKHATATNVVITVAAVDRQVTVEIADDGIGGADPDAGTGLRDLVDRIEALGGRIAVTSPPHAGTRLIAELPLGDEAV
jgi:signal transduction histidine kinase